MLLGEYSLDQELGRLEHTAGSQKQIKPVRSLGPRCAELYSHLDPLGITPMYLTALGEPLLNHQSCLGRIAIRTVDTNIRPWRNPCVQRSYSPRGSCQLESPSAEFMETGAPLNHKLADRIMMRLKTALE